MADKAIEKDDFIEADKALSSAIILEKFPFSLLYFRRRIQKRERGIQVFPALV
jgi:hypothetical protein